MGFSCPIDPLFVFQYNTPVPGGLHFLEAAALLRKLYQSGRTIVGFDLNEVAPGESGDEWDANVAARMLYKLCGWTLKSLVPQSPGHSHLLVARLHSRGCLHFPVAAS